MSAEIIKYEPLHKITTYSKQVYYIESFKIDKFQEELEKSKFIRIKDSVINTASIDTIDPAKTEEIIIEYLLKSEPRQIREEAQKELFIYKEKNPWVELTENKIKLILQKVKGQLQP